MMATIKEKTTVEIVDEDDDTVVTRRDLKEYS